MLILAGEVINWHKFLLSIILESIERVKIGLLLNDLINFSFNNSAIPLS